MSWWLFELTRSSQITFVGVYIWWLIFEMGRFPWINNFLNAFNYESNKQWIKWIPINSEKCSKWAASDLCANYLKKGNSPATITPKKMKFSIKGFSSKCDQIRCFLRILSHLPKKFLMENFIFGAVSFSRFVISARQSIWDIVQMNYISQYKGKNIITCDEIKLAIDSHTNTLFKSNL